MSVLVQQPKKEARRTLSGRFLLGLRRSKEKEGGATTMGGTEEKKKSGWFWRKKKKTESEFSQLEGVKQSGSGANFEALTEREARRRRSRKGQADIRPLPTSVTARRHSVEGTTAFAGGRAKEYFSGGELAYRTQVANNNIDLAFL